MSTKRIVISKSATKKMTSPGRIKANGFTEMVVYKTEISKGKFTSKTKHEKIN
jgi:hypothetical protein